MYCACYFDKATLSNVFRTSRPFCAASSSSHLALVEFVHVADRLTLGKERSSEWHSFLSARKADLKKGFQHLVVLVVVVVILVVCTQVKKSF
jgi:hypothetical protein